MRTYSLEPLQDLRSYELERSPMAGARPMAVGAKLADIPYFPGEVYREDPCREIVYDAIHIISYFLHEGASRRSRLVYFPFSFFPSSVPLFPSRANRKMPDKSGKIRRME